VGFHSVRDFLPGLIIVYRLQHSVGWLMDGRAITVRAAQRDCVDKNKREIIGRATLHVQCSTSALPTFIPLFGPSVFFLSLCLLDELWLNLSLHRSPYFRIREAHGLVPISGYPGKLPSVPASICCSCERLQCCYSNRSDAAI
jgi:hypothetical protein